MGKVQSQPVQCGLLFYLVYSAAPPSTITGLTSQFTTSIEDKGRNLILENKDPPGTNTGDSSILCRQCMSPDTHSAANPLPINYFPSLFFMSRPYCEIFGLKKSGYGSSFSLSPPPPPPPPLSFSPLPTRTECVIIIYFLPSFPLHQNKFCKGHFYGCDFTFIMQWSWSRNNFFFFYVCVQFFYRLLWTTGQHCLPLHRFPI